MTELDKDTVPTLHPLVRSIRVKKHSQLIQCFVMSLSYEDEHCSVKFIIISSTLSTISTFYSFMENSSYRHHPLEHCFINLCFLLKMGTYLACTIRILVLIYIGVLDNVTSLVTDIWE